MKKLPPAKQLLCCVLNQSIMCKYCGTKFCKTCGSPFGPSKHFLVGQCHKRYKPEHIKEAEECEKQYAKLLVNVTDKSTMRGATRGTYRKGSIVIHKCRACKSYSKGRTDRVTIISND